MEQLTIYTPDIMTPEIEQEIKHEIETMTRRANRRAMYTDEIELGAELFRLPSLDLLKTYRDAYAAETAIRPGKRSETARIFDVLARYVGNLPDYVATLAYILAATMTLDKPQNFNFLAQKIGEAIIEETEYRWLESLLNKDSGIMRSYEEQLEKASLAGNRIGKKIRQQAVTSRINERTPKPSDELQANDAVILGTWALLLLPDTLITISKKYATGKTPVRYVTATDELRRRAMEETKKDSYRVSYNVPMITPPRPWTARNQGGTYVHSNSRPAALIKTYNGIKDLTDYIDNQLNNADLSQIYKAVNRIQGTPWRVNKKVLKVAEQIRASGGGIGGYPLDYDLAKKDLLKNNKNWVDSYLAIHNFENKASRIETAMQTAHELRNKTIYMPVHLDWRGRIYTRSVLSYQGGDLQKALLEFDENDKCALPLMSDDDYKWLALHAAGRFGLDKKSYRDRLAWVSAHVTDIKNAARDPITYTGFWAEASDPFQFLASCFALNDFWGGVRKINLPVKYDGTCSGLQHIAALCRSRTLAQKVNLCAASEIDTPQDVYTAMLNDIMTELQIRAENNDYMARKWLNYQNADGTPYGRKNAKRLVMTYAYGAKVYGYEQMILSDIVEAGQFRGDEEKAARYLAKMIAKIMRTSPLFSEAGHLRRYITDIAVAHNRKMKDTTPITWITPLGLPVMSVYVQEIYDYISLRLLGKKIRLPRLDKVADALADKRAQSQALVPNFIHSLDATHLMLTVLSLDNPYWLSVHDCIGVPAPIAGKMLDAARSSFKRLYTECDPLAALGSTEKLELGDYDPAEVTDALYCFC